MPRRPSTPVPLDDASDDEDDCMPAKSGSPVIQIVSTQASPTAGSKAPPHSSTPAPPEDASDDENHEWIVDPHLISFKFLKVDPSNSLLPQISRPPSPMPKLSPYPLPWRRRPGPCVVENFGGVHFGFLALRHDLEKAKAKIEEMKALCDGPSSSLAQRAD